MKFLQVLLNLAASNVLIQSLLAAVSQVASGQAFTTPAAVVTIAGKRWDVSLTVKEHAAS